MDGRQTLLSFHPNRDAILAEAHARPSEPLPTPTLATRITALSGDLEKDLAHMVALCRRLQVPEPASGARWCLADAGAWRVRWERHTEVSSWTFYRPLAEGAAPAPSATALDVVPRDWLAGLPGQVIVAAHVALLRSRSADTLTGDEIAASVTDGAAQVFTDFRPGADGFTRFLVVQPAPDAPAAGRTMLQLFEIESYRLLALLGFPAAGEAAAELSRLEQQAVAAALRVSETGGIEADRKLLGDLAALAASAQSITARTSFRFGASRAYYGLVLERIQQLREQRFETRPTISEFMERRLAPAMRTIDAVAERQQRVIEHIARSSQLLSTRVEVAAEATNASVLASLDKRASLQLRLQQAVEGLSVTAISYYLVGLINYVFYGLEELNRGFDHHVATAIAAPFVVGGVWLTLRSLRKRILDGN